MAHPVRFALLEALAREGPLTATRAAELVGGSPSSCSFHLRQLAKYGFVEEAGGGTGRERPWRAIPESKRWSDFGSDTGSTSAGTALTATLARREFGRLMAWLDEGRSYPPEWRDAGALSQSLLYMTADELRDLGEAVVELARPYFERMLDPSTRPPGSKPVAMFAFAVPIHRPRPAADPRRCDACSPSATSDCCSPGRPCRCSATGRSSWPWGSG